MQSEVWPLTLTLNPSHSHPHSQEHTWQLVHQGLVTYFRHSVTSLQLQKLSGIETLPLVLCVALTCDSKTEHIIEITKLKGSQ